MAVIKKKDLVCKIAETVNEKNDNCISPSLVDEIVTATLNNIRQCIVNGDDVQLADFGTFSSSVRAARKGRNPATGEAIDIPAKKVIAFKASASFKAALNGENSEKAD